MKQGAPEEITSPGFRQEYFKFDPAPRWLVEIRSGLEWRRGTAYDPRHGIRAGDWEPAPTIPGFIPSIIEEDPEREGLLYTPKYISEMYTELFVELDLDHAEELKAG